ncbi:hypothetical protein [Dyadobacter sediminis]|uniref:Uncharacterized protein n=1 Tax=Dyadobacter sediminis TaxID=1493691 RepID=A0A5R9KAA0_9BACT|nr:hypothetical protein [Dyadobacter sediminis]TLU91695.1 hypothetical protein FEM55_12985 [Dyadobacter sediminis]GGC01135.1 hypothetical protein GCM10011325_30380 [Dyadobacter sediminis]
MKAFLIFVFAGAGMLGMHTPAIAQKDPDCGKVTDPCEVRAHAAVSECIYTPTYAAEEAGEFKKYVRYNDDSGVLFLKYEFVKNSEEFIYEKTINAVGKSKEERKQIILEFEDEIAFPGRETPINL